MSQLFTGNSHSKLYRQFRPVYPAKVLDCILEYCKRGSNQFQICLDLGCGSGQSTRPLCDNFKSIIGVDTSETQISEARNISADTSNVEFIVGSAEDLSFQQNSSVDLITIAQTFHWVDQSKFYPECTRVLRPGAVLAVYGYGNVWLDNDESSAVISKYYKEILWGQNLWDDRRHHIDNHYQEFTPLLLEDFQRIDSIVMTKKMSLADLMGYLSTWSAYQTLKKKEPHTLVLDDVHSQLRKAYNAEDSASCQVEVNWPIFLLLGRKAS